MESKAKREYHPFALPFALNIDRVPRFLGMVLWMAQMAALNSNVRLGVLQRG